MKMVIGVILAFVVFSIVAFGLGLGLPMLWFQINEASVSSSAKAGYLSGLFGSELVKAISYGAGAISAGYIFSKIGKPQSFVSAGFFCVVLAILYCMNATAIGQAILLAIVVLFGSLLGAYIGFPASPNKSMQPTR